MTAVDYISGQGRPRFEATIYEGAESAGVGFVSGAYLRRQIHPGDVLRVQGLVQYFRGIPQMMNPKWEIVQATTESVEKAKLRAIYPAT